MWIVCLLSPTLMCIISSFTPACVAGEEADGLYCIQPTSRPLLLPNKCLFAVCSEKQSNLAIENLVFITLKIALTSRVSSHTHTHTLHTHTYNLNDTCEKGTLKRSFKIVLDFKIKYLMLILHTVNVYRMFYLVILTYCNLTLLTDIWCCKLHFCMCF